MHLPSQLAAVDPIVASFCGGAVGVLTTLLLVELYNSDIQAKNRCIYCGVSQSSTPPPSCSKHRIRSPASKVACRTHTAHTTLMVKV